MHAAGEPPTEANARGGFTSRLVLIAGGGLALRIGYVLAFRWHEPLRGDEVFYSFQANALADGHGFTNPITGRAAADHPPLTALVLTPASWLTDHSVVAQRLTMAVLGTLVVVAVGLLAREVAGPRVGLIAALLAAVYPAFWVGDGVAMSEPVATLGVVATMFFAYRLIARPAPRWAALMGLGIALATLARAELVLLVPFVALPSAWYASRRSVRRTLASVAVTLLTIAVLVMPWIGFNLVRFERTTLLSSNDGLTLAGANCPTTYFGSGIGFWYLSCVPPARSGDQSIADGAWRHDALSFAYHHAGRLPLVVLSRVGRMWGVYSPIQTARFAEGEGRPHWASYLSLAGFYLVVAGAIVGVVRLRRRQVVVAPLIGTLVLVTVTAAMFYGVPRFRAPADAALLVLAAAAIGTSGRGAPAEPSRYQ